MIKNPYIIKFTKYEVQSKETVTYFISVTDTTTGENWTVKTRYSTMSDLHENLKKEVKVSLPEFPPKKWFGNTDPTFISQRLKALENYLNVVLNQGGALSSPSLQHFLTSQRSSASSEGGKKPLETPPRPTEPAAKPKEPQPADAGGPKGSPAPMNPGNGVGGTPKLEQKKGSLAQETNREKELKKVVTEFLGKMIDLSSALNPPEDYEFKKRNAYYRDQLTMAFSLIGPLYKVPAASEAAKDSALQPTIVSRDRDLMKGIDDLGHGVAECMNVLQPTHAGKDEIHFVIKVARN
jgi:hypothetical protein